MPCNPCAAEPVSTNPTAGLLEVPASTRVRVSSCSVRELSKGKFLIKSDSITLQNCIGEGMQLAISNEYEKYTLFSI